MMMNNIHAFMGYLPPLPSNAFSYLLWQHTNAKNTASEDERNINECFRIMDELHEQKVILLEDQIAKLIEFDMWYEDEMALHKGAKMFAHVDPEWTTVTHTRKSKP